VVGVLRGEFVTTTAPIRAPRDCPGGIAAASVLGEGHRLQVVRVDARGNPAEVVESQSVRDYTLRHLVGDSVSRLDLAVDLDVPVSEGVTSAGPQPAIPGLVNLLPESDLEWDLVCRH
jgi:hypothetical protein